MKRKTTAAILFVLIILLNSCGKQDVVVLNDIYTDFFMKSEMSPKLFFFKKTLLTRGYNFHYLRLQNAEDTIALLSGLDNPETGFIISPIVYLWLDESGYKWQGRVTVFNVPEQWELAPSCKAVVTDRTESFREAGILAGRIVSSSEDGYAAAYFYTGNKIREREKNSFIEGFQETADINHLLTHSFSSTENHNIDTFRNAVKENNIVVSCIFASSLNDYVLTLVKNKNNPIVTEDQRTSGVMQEKLVSTIETDYPALLNASYEYLTDESDSGDIKILSRFIIPKKLKKTQKGG